MNIHNWFYPQILLLAWFAWRIVSQFRRLSEKKAEVRASIEQDHRYTFAFMSDELKSSLETIAVIIAITAVYAPALALVYLGGFFK